MSANNGPAAPKPVRCAIYTRQSTDEGLNQDFNSLDAQPDSSPTSAVRSAPVGRPFRPASTMAGTPARTWTRPR
jgi:hypothetical protein